MYCWQKRLFFPFKKLIDWLATSAWWKFFIQKMPRSFSMISHRYSFIFHTQSLIHPGDHSLIEGLDWSHHSEAITLLLVFFIHLLHACFKSGKKNILMGWRNKEAAISLPYSLDDDEVESIMQWLEPDLSLAMGIAADPNLIK